MVRFQEARSDIWRRLRAYGYLRFVCQFTEGASETDCRAVEILTTANLQEMLARAGPKTLSAITAAEAEAVELPK